MLKWDKPICRGLCVLYLFTHYTCETFLIALSYKQQWNFKAPGIYQDTHFYFFFYWTLSLTQCICLSTMKFCLRPEQNIYYHILAVQILCTPKMHTIVLIFSQGDPSTAEYWAGVCSGSTSIDKSAETFLCSPLHSKRIILAVQQLHCSKKCPKPSQPLGHWVNHN